MDKDGRDSRCSINLIFHSDREFWNSSSVPPIFRRVRTSLTCSRSFLGLSIKKIVTISSVYEDLVSYASLLYSPSSSAYGKASIEPTATNVGLPASKPEVV